MTSTLESVKVNKPMIENADQAIASLISQIGEMQASINDNDAAIRALQTKRENKAPTTTEQVKQLEQARLAHKNAQTAASLAKNTPAEAATKKRVSELAERVKAAESDLHIAEQERESALASIDQEIQSIYAAIEEIRTTMTVLDAQRSELYITRNRLHAEYGQVLFDELTSRVAAGRVREADALAQLKSIRVTLAHDRAAMLEGLADWPELQDQAFKELGMPVDSEGTDDAVMAILRSHLDFLNVIDAELQNAFAARHFRYNDTGYDALKIVNFEARDLAIASSGRGGITERDWLKLKKSQVASMLDMYERSKRR